ncbi:MAG TPA: hypothetical protein VGL53_01190, partial [Bryobacteraceae bacterium]
ANAGKDDVCTLKKLAGLVMERYGSGRPIGTVKVTNSQQEPTYLVLLPGMEGEKPGQATMAGDALIGFLNISSLDAYRQAIMDAVSKLPRRSTLILAGHSLGGIEAQNVVQSLVQRYGFNVAKVISFGAPIMDVKQPGTTYLNVRSPSDPLAALDKRFSFDPGELLRSKDGPDKNPFAPNGSHNNYDQDSSGLNEYDMNGRRLVSNIKGKCFEIDLTTLQGTPAPDFVSRVTNGGKCPPDSMPSAVKCSWQPKSALPNASPSSAAMERGLLFEDENYLKRLAASRCLTFIVRDSSEPALRWIGRPGYKAKPAAIKGKTLKAIDLIPYSPDQMKQYLGLASARGMTPEDRKKLMSAGYNIQPTSPELILDQDGSKFYSDTDLHGVYDANGNNAWSDALGKELKCGTVDQGIQHPPHDDWADRNNKAAAGQNCGPQIGNGKTITAIFPDGTTRRATTLAEMKELYQAIGVSWNNVYPPSGCK